MAENWQKIIAYTNWKIITTPLLVESRVDCNAYIDRMTINAIQEIRRCSQRSRAANSVPLPETWYTHRCNLSVLASWRKNLGSLQVLVEFIHMLALLLELFFEMLKPTTEVSLYLEI